MDYKEKVIALLNSKELSNEQKEKLEGIFPELKESEDERIRKNLIGYIKGISKNEVCEETKDSWIAWLEKQGEQKPQGMSALEASKEEKVDNQNCVKPADKVESKFHEGDWVVSPNGVYWHIDAIQNGRYEVTADTGQCGNCWSLDTNIYRLWTIQDAKDGDVLYECNEKKPFIFKELETKHIGDIASYCDIFDGIFNPNEDDWTTLDVVPATKEQRDLLFKKMKEAGYEWDAGKKELKKVEQKSVVIIPKFRIGDNIKTTNEKPLTITKIDDKGYWSEDLFICDFNEECIWDLVEQKPSWSEEDELHIRELESFVKQVLAIAEHENDKDTIHKMSDLSFFLKTFKPQLKQEWSKKDEDKLNRIYEILPKCIDCHPIECKELQDWLKSLRPQNTWKPSDEQMKVLKILVDTSKGFDHSKILESLYNDLKKLKN